MPATGCASCGSGPSGWLTPAGARIAASPDPEERKPAEAPNHYRNRRHRRRSAAAITAQAWTGVYTRGPTSSEGHSSPKQSLERNPAPQLHLGGGKARGEFLVDLYQPLDVLESVERKSATRMHLTSWQLAAGPTPTPLRIGRQSPPPRGDRASVWTELGVR